MTTEKKLMKKRTICITGASSGIGKTLCYELVSQGYTVIGIARRKNILDEIAKTLNNSCFIPFECDVSKLESVENTTRLCAQKNLFPDVVICAAGISKSDILKIENKTILDISSTRETMEINFFGVLNTIQAFSKEARKRIHFIALSSIAAWKPSKRSFSYPASKAALSMTFRGINLASNNFSLSTVYLGPVNTTMWEGKKTWIVISPEEAARKISKLIEHPKTVAYIPFMSTTFSRLSLLIPDSIYAKLSSYFFK